MTIKGTRCMLYLRPSVPGRECCRDLLLDRLDWHVGLTTALLLPKLLPSLLAGGVVAGGWIRAKALSVEFWKTEVQVRSTCQPALGLSV